MLLQVNASEEPQKHGFAYDALEGVIAHVKAFKGLSVQGLMGMAAAGADKERLDQTFSKLQSTQTSLQAKGFKLPALSMGMSGDVHRAVRYGATHVRLGSVLFGSITSEEQALLRL